MNAARTLDATFAALADPTRRAIMLRLIEGEATVNELVEPFNISQPAVSRHLKVLESAGLIKRRVDGPRRPCRLSETAFDALEAYLSKFSEALETNYTRLDEVLVDMSKRKHRSKHK